MTHKWLALGVTKLAAIMLAASANVEDQPPTEGIDELPLDAPPIPIKVATPKYPRDAIRRELNGRTVACFKIDARGRIRNAQVVQTSDKLFTRATLAAIKRSTFRPARRGNETVAASYCRSYRFDLNPRSR